MIDFFVRGIPKATPRMKACIRGDRAGVYDPGTAAEWKTMVYLEAKQRRPKEPFTVPIRCDITFFMPRPKSLMRKKDYDGIIPHDKKPDRDNLEKTILDALTLAGFWKDDSQVYCGEVRKYYHGKGGSPGCNITVKEDRGDAIA